MLITSNWSVPVLLKKGYELTTFQNPTVVTPTLVDNGQYFNIGGALYGNKFYYFYLTDLKCYNLDTNENTSITTTGDPIVLQSGATVILADIFVSKYITQKCMFLIGGTDGTYDYQTITRINLDTFVVSRYVSTILRQDTNGNAVERLGIIYNFGIPGSSASFKWSISDREFIPINDPPFKLEGGFCEYNELTDEIIFIGGYSGVRPPFPNELLTFDPNTDNYIYKTGKSHLPQIYIKRGARLNNDIYTVGGIDESGMNGKVYCFSLDKYTYTQVGLLPNARANTTQFIYNNKLYYATGLTDVGYIKDLSYGDITINCFADLSILTPTVGTVDQNPIANNLTINCSSFDTFPISGKDEQIETDIEIYSNISNPPVLNIKKITPPFTSGISVSNLNDYDIGEYSIRVKYIGQKYSSNWSEYKIIDIPNKCQSCVISSDSDILNFRTFEKMFYHNELDDPNVYRSSLLFDNIRHVLVWLAEKCNKTIKTENILINHYPYGSSDDWGDCTTPITYYMKYMSNLNEYRIRFKKPSYGTYIEGIPNFKRTVGFHLTPELSDENDYFCTSIVDINTAANIFDNLKFYDFFDDGYPATSFDIFTSFYTYNSLPVEGFVLGTSSYFDESLQQTVIYTSKEHYIDQFLKTKLPILYQQRDNIIGFALYRFKEKDQVASNVYDEWYIPIKMDKTNTRTICDSKPEILTPITDTRLTTSLTFNITLSEYTGIQSLLRTEVLVYHYWGSCFHLHLLTFEPGATLTINTLELTEPTNEYFEVPNKFPYYYIKARYIDVLDRITYWSDPIKILSPLPVAAEQSMSLPINDEETISYPPGITFKANPSDANISYSNFYDGFYCSVIQFQISQDINFSTILSTWNLDVFYPADERTYEFTPAEGWFINGPGIYYVRTKKHYGLPSLDVYSTIKTIILT